MLVIGAYVWLDLLPRLKANLNEGGGARDEREAGRLLMLVAFGSGLEVALGLIAFLLGVVFSSLGAH